MKHFKQKNASNTFLFLRIIAAKKQTQFCSNQLTDSGENTTKYYSPTNFNWIFFENNSCLSELTSTLKFKLESFPAGVYFPWLQFKLVLTYVVKMDNQQNGWLAGGNFSPTSFVKDSFQKDDSDFFKKNAVSPSKFVIFQKLKVFWIFAKVHI